MTRVRFGGSFPRVGKSQPGDRPAPLSCVGRQHRPKLAACKAEVQAKGGTRPSEFEPGTTHHYDANDNLVSTSATGKNGQPGGGNVSLASATAQYNPQGRCTRTTAKMYAYDGLGRLTQASNNVSISGFPYDSLGDTLSETQDGLTTTSTHNVLGKRLSIAYPGGRTLAS